MIEHIEQVLAENGYDTVVKGGKNKPAPIPIPAWDGRNVPAEEVRKRRARNKAAAKTRKKNRR